MHTAFSEKGVRHSRAQQVLVQHCLPADRSLTTFLRACTIRLSSLSASLKDWTLALQFLGISFVVGKEALGHIQAEQGPEEGGMLLLLAAASVIVLSALCGLKLDLSVSFWRLPAQLSAFQIVFMYSQSCAHDDT